jgi:PAS domain S-box-containing protein
MNDKLIISYLTDVVRSVINGKMIDDLMPFPEDDNINDELKALYSAIDDLIPIYNQGVKAIRHISRGELDVDIDIKEPIFGPIKNLQSGLKDLIGQNKQLAKGNYSLQTDFPGDFNQSYTLLINSLREKERLEQELYESQKKYELIANKSQDIIWIFDLRANKYVYISPSVEALRGFTVEEAKNQSLRESLCTSSYDKIIQRLSRPLNSFSKEERLKYKCDEYQQPCKDGSILEVETNISLICDENGAPKELIGISRDITQRKKVELALKQSEEKYRLIAENTLDVIWKVDIKTLKYTYISPSIFYLSGYTVDELINQSIKKLFTQVSYLKILTTFRNYTEYLEVGNLHFCDQYQLCSKDGRTIDVEINATLLKNDNGVVNEILGVTRDITARVKVENALKESEAKLSKLLERQTWKNRRLNHQFSSIYNNVTHAIAFFEIDEGIIRFSSCNRLWAQTLGYLPENIEGLNIESVCDKETEALHRKCILEATTQNKPVHTYLKWKRRSLYAVFIPIYYENRVHASECAGLVYDVTDKVKAELKIRESEEKFSTIFHHSSDIIVVLSFNLEVLEVNERFYQLTGFDRDLKRIFNMNNLGVYIPEKYHRDIFNKVEELKQGKLLCAFESELYRSNRETIPIEINGSLVNLGSSTVILCIIRDASVRKSLEKKLTQIGILIENRERQKLASDLHDNVGPLLSSMNMYLSVLSRKPDLKSYLGIINDIERILKETIFSVREISNDLSPQVLKSFGLISALKHFFESKNKLINIELTDNIDEYRFSEMKEIMIYNIIKEAFNNTIKYSKAKAIKLNINKNNNWLTVMYSDDGIGFNLEQKLNTNHGGLGLYSIINRIKNINGNYEIKTSPGDGFLLKIVFPTSD